jgi:hypothetical protein
MTIEIPVTYTDIKNTYDELEVCITEAFKAQVHLNLLEVRKTEIWGELTSNPEFKPGNSNLQRDAKIRIANPLFMDEYEQATAALDKIRFEVDLVRNKLGCLKDMLTLGKILVAVQEE